MPQDQGQYANITTNTTTVLNTRQGGILKRIIVNTVGTTSTVTVYDNTAGSGTKIATLSSVAQVSLEYNAQYANGLTIVTAGAAAADITVVYT